MMFSKAALVSLLVASSNAFVVNQPSQTSRIVLNESSGLDIGGSMEAAIRKQVGHDLPYCLVCRNDAMNRAIFIMDPIIYPWSTPR